MPVFHPFRGFSCIFDDAGKEEVFYELTNLALQKIEPQTLVTTFLFCPLPLSSYHITVWDGINEGNLDSIDNRHKPYFQEFLNNISTSLELDAPFSKFLESNALIENKAWYIGLKFKELVIWPGGPVLVASLEAADEESKKELSKLEKHRTKLYQDFEKELGINMYREYTPHVTIGYFANKEGADKAIDHLSKWNKVFESTLNDATIRFNSVSLYGFENMTNFFKPRQLKKIQFLLGSTQDLPTIRRLMNMHNFYRTVPDFYMGNLTREAIKKMKSGTYSPNIDKTSRLQDSYHTSLIIKLNRMNACPLFKQLEDSFNELANLIKDSFSQS